LAITLISTVHLHATLRTWTGSATNAYWTVAANWGGVAPVAGDDLQFPSIDFELTTTNDFRPAPRSTQSSFSRQL